MKRYIKIFLLELVVVLIVLALVFNYKKTKDSPATYVEELSINQIEENNPEVIGDKEENENKDDLYIKLENALLSGDEDVNIDLSSLFVEAEKLFSILESISYENPEIMYYKGAEYSFGKIKLIYSRPTGDIEKHQDEIRKVRSEFFRENIDKNMSDYEKVLSIHDYVVERGEYDTRLISEGQVPPESYSTYGILGLGVGVCESYAKSMKYLFDKAGIESMIVIGKSRGENHAWNLVNIEGDYYHVDATWDDPIIEDGSQVIRYNFLNLNDEQMERTHSWKKENYPAAYGKEYNYYNYNNLIAEDSKQLIDNLTRALLNREDKYTVRVLKIDENLDLNNIIENIGYKNYEMIMLKGYSYYLDEEQNIFSFQFFYH